MRQQVSGVLSQCRHWGAGRRRGESGHREPSNQLTSTSKKYNRRKLCAQPRSASSSSSHSALEEAESASSFISMNLDNEQWSSDCEVRMWGEQKHFSPDEICSFMCSLHVNISGSTSSIQKKWNNLKKSQYSDFKFL